MAYSARCREYSSINKMPAETTYRNITESELHFYSVMSAHYKERASALPHVTFLRRDAKTFTNIVKTKQILTYEYE
jgi:hypothetical protein